MRSLREAWTRTAAFFRKRALDRDLDEELTAHVEMATDELVGRGVPAPEARRRALARLGGLEAARLHHREARGLPWLDGLVQDVRYAVRSLRRSPGFTVTAVVILALGIGMNAAVFTLANAILFKGYPYLLDNDRFLYIHTVVDDGPADGPSSYPDFQGWRTETRSFDDMAAVTGLPFNLGDDGRSPERYLGSQVTANTFRLLGQQPILGRDFTADDERAGAAPVVVLGYSVWTGRYAGDPAIVGRTVRLNGVPTTVIGVMARGFAFPYNEVLWAPVPFTPDRQQRGARRLWLVVGRLADDATVDGARADIDAVARRLADAYPATNTGVRPSVQTFRAHWIGARVALVYGALLGAVGLVLLIACANVANLLMARAMTRAREMALRVALGAPRWRVVRQLLVENLILSAAGGSLGWILAQWGVGARLYEVAAFSAFPNGTPAWFDFTMDGRVLGYVMAASLGAALLFGFLPSLRLSAPDVNGTLKGNGRLGVTPGRQPRRLSDLLVVGEVALAVVLLAGAGVMVRSFLHVHDARIGVESARVLTAHVALPAVTYRDPRAQIAFFDRLQPRLRAIPGMETVALADRLPTEETSRLTYERTGVPTDVGRRPAVSTIAVSPGYFEALGSAVHTGRDFTDADDASRTPVAIVNDSFANRQWPGQDPIGRSLRVVDGSGRDSTLTIVGVAAGIVQDDRTRQLLDPVVYLPFRQAPSRSMYVVARTRVDPDSLGPAVRRAMQAVDADLPVAAPASLDERLASDVTYRLLSAMAVLLLVCAAVGLLLASTGLYAIGAHGVSQRTQEIGVRMAVGSTAREVCRLVLAQGLRQAGVGLCLGLLLSSALTRLLSAQLVGVSPLDPLTLVVASAALIAAAAVGCLIPARRAMRVDPVVALRHD